MIRVLFEEEEDIKVYSEEYEKEFRWNLLKSGKNKEIKKEAV